MKKISGIEKIEELVGRWAPSDLAVIEGIVLRNRENAYGSSLTIDALFQPKSDSWPNFDEEMFRVSIQFDNVRGLGLKDFGGDGVQVMGFDVQFVGDRGLEGISYEIRDYEDGRIRFSCDEISIRTVERVLPRGSRR